MKTKSCLTVCEQNLWSLYIYVFVSLISQELFQEVKIHKNRSTFPWKFSPDQLCQESFLKSCKNTYDFPGDHTQEQILCKIASSDAFAPMQSLFFVTRLFWKRFGNRIYEFWSLKFVRNSEFETVSSTGLLTLQ